MANRSTGSGQWTNMGNVTTKSPMEATLTLKHTTILDMVSYEWRLISLPGERDDWCAPISWRKYRQMVLFFGAGRSNSRFQKLSDRN